MRSEGKSLTTDFTDLLIFKIDVGDSLDAQGGRFEIENQADFEVGDAEVAENLGDVDINDLIHDFGLNDHSGIYDQIRNQFSNIALMVVDWKNLLLCKLDRSFCKFDAE